VEPWTEPIPVTVAYLCRFVGDFIPCS
jgi:hypothetical protein